MGVIMGIPSFLKVETFGVYTQDSSSKPNDIGEMPKAVASSMHLKGTVTGRVTPGDALEPDILGPMKNGTVDVATQWIGFSSVPVGFEIEVGDWMINTSDSTRKFQVQFVDRYPGGMSGHHYELQLQTTELERNL
jgi:hypothetical protein